MKLDEFTIEYRDQNLNDVILKYTWTPLIAEKFTISCHAGDAFEVNGYQVWIRYSGTPGNYVAQEFVSGEKDAKEFFRIGTSEEKIVVLGALKRLDDVPIVSTTVLVLQSQWGTSVELEGRTFCDMDLEFTFDGETVTYDYVDRYHANLVLPAGLSGTGALYLETFGSDGRIYAITICSVGDVDDATAVIS